MAVTYTLSVGAKWVRVRKWLDGIDSQMRSREVCEALDAYLTSGQPTADIATVLKEIRSLREMVAGARLFVEGGPPLAQEREAIPGLDGMLEEFEA